MFLPLLGWRSAWGSEKSSLTSSMQKFEELPVSREETAAFRSILEGKTHTGDYLEVHETVLEPNAGPHPPHRHEGEELFLISSGMLEFTIGGKSARLGAGSAAFVASNEEHGVRNVGSTPAQYFVVTLGKKTG